MRPLHGQTLALVCVTATLLMACGTSASSGTDAGPVATLDVGTDAAVDVSVDASMDAADGIYRPGPETRGYGSPDCADARLIALGPAAVRSAYPGILCDRGLPMPAFSSIEECLDEATGSTQGTCLPSVLPPTVFPYTNRCPPLRLYTYDEINSLRSAAYCDGGM